MFIVMRIHTVKHCANNVVWKVASRPVPDRRTADDLCEFLQSEYDQDNHKIAHKFFVIETDFRGLLGTMNKNNS